MKQLSQFYFGCLHGTPESVSKHWFVRGGHLGSLSLDMQRSVGSSMDHEEQPVLVDEDRTDEVCSPLIIFPFAEFINRLQG